MREARAGPGPAIRSPPAYDAPASGWQDAPYGSLDACFLLRRVADDLVFEEVNPTFEMSTGLESASVVGLTLQDVLPEAVAAGVTERFQRGEWGARAKPLTVIVPLPVGRTPWEISLAPRFDEDGALAGVCGIAREVRENIGPQLGDAQDLEDEGDRLPNIRFTAFPDGRIERVHPSFMAMGGLPLDSPIAAVIALVCPEDLARLTPSPDCVQEGGAYETDVRVRDAGGRYRWFRIRAELTDGLAGRRWYGVAIDIDAEKKRGVRGLTSTARRVNALAGQGGRGVTIDRAWRIIGLTSEAAACAGRSETRLLGADCRERMTIPKALIDAVEASLADQAPRRLEISAPNRPGRWMEFQINPFAAGATIGWNVSPRRRADEAAPLALDWPDDVPGSATSEMALLDRDGVVVSVNAVWLAKAREFEGGGAQHGVGASYLELCRAGIPDFDESALAAGMSHVMAGNQAEYAQPYVIATPRGLWWRRLRIIPYRFKPSVQLIAVHEDITDVGQARAALRTPPEQLMSALAHERERIAFELHDSTSQHLTALGLGLIRLKRLAGDGAEELIADMTKSVQETVREIRVLSYLMKPSELERDGLQPAARLFVSGFGTRTGLDIKFRTAGSFTKIAESVQNAAFRVLQEALSNVYRHAHASRAEVDLISKGGALMVRIADDGRGISKLGAGELRVAPGVGLASMESRVTQLGGTLNISRGVVGTIVEASIPVGPAA